MFLQQGLQAQTRFTYLGYLRRQGSGDYTCAVTLLFQDWAACPAHCVDPNSTYSGGDRPVLHFGSADARNGLSAQVRARHPCRPHAGICLLRLCKALTWVSKDADCCIEALANTCGIVDSRDRWVPGVGLFDVSTVEYEMSVSFVTGVSAIPLFALWHCSC